ncbi:EF-hand domain-containing protein, partial [bacterium]|nr:EF-hand domain-containing protein [bacterium]
MKTATWFAVLLFGATFALAAGPAGEGKGHGGPPKGKGHRRPPKEVIEKFDEDGDGKLSPKERHAAMKARRERTLAKFDTDGDGKLSKEELAAVPEPIRERILQHRKMMAKFDKDGDGK